MNSGASVAATSKETVNAIQWSLGVDRKLHSFVQNSEQAPDVVFGTKVPMEESESGDLMSSTFRIHERDISTCCSQSSGECR